MAQEDHVKILIGELEELPQEPGKHVIIQMEEHGIETENCTGDDNRGEEEKALVYCPKHRGEALALAEMIQVVEKWKIKPNRPYMIDLSHAESEEEMEEEFCADRETPEDPGEQDALVQIPMEPEIEDWVGVHSVGKIPTQLQNQKHKFWCFSKNNFLSEWAEDHSLEKNRMAVLSVPPGVSNETEALKQLFETTHQLPSDPRHKIILLDAKSSGNLSHSFEKVVKKCFPKSEIDNGNQIVSVGQGITNKFCTLLKWPPFQLYWLLYFTFLARFWLRKFTSHHRRSAGPSVEKDQYVDEFYQEIKNKSDAKNQYLFVFVGAPSFAEIQPYLPQKNCLLPFCQFFVLTSSKISRWESENWTIEKLMLFANDTFPIHFNWQGVYSASELPPKKFKPVANFKGRGEILKQLVDRFNQRLSQLTSRSTFTVLTGVAGIGKTELIKKFLSLDDARSLFTRIVLIDASELDDSLTICAYNLNFKFGIKTDILNLDSEMPEKFVGLKSESGDVARLISMITTNQRVLFVIDGAESLEQIKKCLPKNSKNCDVIVTSGNRDWGKEKVGTFYRENGYDFYEIQLFQGLSLEETQEFCTEILPNTFNVPENLERAVKTLYECTGGFPTVLQTLSRFISASSETHPEWPLNLHILNFVMYKNRKFKTDGDSDSDSGPWKKLSSFLFYTRTKGDEGGETLALLEMMCILNSDHLDFDIIRKLYLSIPNKFQNKFANKFANKFSRRESFEFGARDRNHTEQQLERRLLVLESNCAIQIVRRADGTMEKIVLPVFIKESVNPGWPTAINDLQDILFQSKSKPSRRYPKWKICLNDARLEPHLRSLNENYSRYHGYFNEFLINGIKKLDEDDEIGRNAIKQIDGLYRRRNTCETL